MTSSDLREIASRINAMCGALYNGEPMTDAISDDDFRLVYDWAQRTMSSTPNPASASGTDETEWIGTLPRWNAVKVLRAVASRLNHDDSDQRAEAEVVRHIATALESRLASSPEPASGGPGAEVRGKNATSNEVEDLPHSTAVVAWVVASIAFARGRCAALHELDLEDGEVPCDECLKRGDDVYAPSPAAELRIDDEFYRDILDVRTLNALYNEYAHEKIPGADALLQYRTRYYPKAREVFAKSDDELSRVRNLGRKGIERIRRAEARMLASAEHPSTPAAAREARTWQHIVADVSLLADECDSFGDFEAGHRIRRAVGLGDASVLGCETQGASVSCATNPTDDLNAIYAMLAQRDPTVQELFDTPAFAERSSRLFAALAAVPRSEIPDDAARWQKLVRLVAENHMHRGLGGGVYLASAPANEHDAAWASIQAIDHENPRNTLWMIEGASLADAIDKVAAPGDTDEMVAAALNAYFRDPPIKTGLRAPRPEGQSETGSD